MRRHDLLSKSNCRHIIALSKDFRFQTQHPSQDLEVTLVVTIEDDDMITRDCLYKASQVAIFEQTAGFAMGHPRMACGFGNTGLFRKKLARIIPVMAMKSPSQEAK
jgi:hypothetical protein